MLIILGQLCKNIFKTADIKLEMMTLPNYMLQIIYYSQLKEEITLEETF